MKQKNTGLKKLFALALGLSAFSCHDITDLGYGIGEDNTINAIYTDTLSIGYSTVLSDSAVNSNTSLLLFGSMVDPIFGPVEAQGYFQPSLTPQINTSGTVITNSAGVILYDTLVTKDGAIIDSLKLRLYTSGLVYGDTNSVSKFTIHRLRNLMSTTNYDASQTQAYDPQPLAQFDVRLSDMRDDSTGVLKAKFVTLPKELASELIYTAREANGTNSDFISKYKGFAIIPDKNNKAVYGFNTGVLNINGTNSSLIPYWHFEGDTTSQFHIFNLNGPRYSSLKFDRSKTPLATLSKTKNELPISATNDKLYLQGGSGISPMIDISAISGLGKIKIAKAVLELQIDPTSVNNLYHKSYYSVTAEVGTNNQQKRSNTNALTYIYGRILDSPVGGATALSDSSKYLNVDLTNYLQRLDLNGDFNRKVLLLPAVISSTSATGILSNDNLSRLVFLRPRLLLYYNKQ